MSTPVLPDEGHFFVVSHPSEWPENTAPGFTQQIWGDDPADAVHAWAIKTDKEGGFSGDPYPYGDEMMVRDHTGKEWTVKLYTDFEPHFSALVQEDGE